MWHDLQKLQKLKFAQIFARPIAPQSPKSETLAPSERFSATTAWSPLRGAALRAGSGPCGASFFFFFSFLLFLLSLFLLFLCFSSVLFFSFLFLSFFFSFASLLFFSSLSSSPGQIRPEQARSGKVRPDQARSGQIRSGQAMTTSRAWATSRAHDYIQGP